MTVRKIAIHLGNFAVWTGGVNYLLNMARAIKLHAKNWSPAIYSSVELPQHLNARAQSAMATGDMVKFLAGRGRLQTVQSMCGGHDNFIADQYQKDHISIVFEAAGYLGSNFPLPILTWLPDFQHRHLPHFFPKTAWVARELRFRKILATRRHLLLSSEDAAKDLLDFYPGTRAKVHVVSFAVEQPPELTTEKIKAVRLKYDLPENFLYLPNQFWIHKNHEIVVESLVSLKDPSLVIAMSGNPEDARAPRLLGKLKEMIASNGLSQNVRMLGQIPYSDVIALIAAARALVNPSLFEGWSTTVEEAKSLGTPMILSDLPVHREQALRDAIFFDPRSVRSCADALFNPTARTLTHFAAQQQAAKSFAAYGQRLEDVFREVLAENSSYRRRSL